MINELRRNISQEQMEGGVSETNYLDPGKPGWFSEHRIMKRLDARPLLDEGRNPLPIVLKDVQELGTGDIYELTTAFLPAPLIDNVRAKSFLSWSNRMGDEIIKTFFMRKGSE